MDNIKLCPRCKTENPLPANFCRHCCYKFPKETKRGTTFKPKILRFSVIESSYTYGSVIHIIWEVWNATTLMLNGEDVSSVNSMDYLVSGAETITLLAENDYNKTERSIRLSPRPLPNIISFFSSQKLVQQGQIVELMWKVQSGRKIVLVSLDGKKDVSHTDTIKVKPYTTMKYLLRCFAEDEKVYVEKELVVEVVLPVEINSFIADKDVIVESDKVTLRWDVVNATSIILYPLMKDITSLKEYTISPQRTSEYKLIATNGLSQKEKTVQINVLPLPKIDINFGDVLSMPRIPLVDVGYSLLFPNVKIKEVDVDRWMTTRPIEKIKSEVRINEFLTSIKTLYNKITSL